MASEDELLALVEDIPEWQQQALLDLATGKSLEDVRSDYGIGDEPTEDPEQSLQRPVSRMEFVTIQDDDALRRMIEGDFEEWRTFLHPQQRVLAERPVYNGPFRLAGGAGTGKTVVALHRAELPGVAAGCSSAALHLQPHLGRAPSKRSCAGWPRPMPCAHGSTSWASTRP